MKKTHLQVYVAYSHNDEVWRERILVHLAPLEQMGQLSVWTDRDLSSGDNWSQQIAQAINDADIAVLLISADFLASSFLANEEIPKMLERHERQELVILPVIVRPCAWHSIDWLVRLQVLPRDGRPLSTRKNLDEALLEVAKRIVETGEIISSQKTSAQRVPPRKKIASTLGTSPPAASPSRPTTQKNGHIFICHNSGDGDFAELLKLKLEKAGYEAWIDVDRLRVGVDWRAEIDEALRDAAAVIVVMTPDAKLSEYVTYEWAYATGAEVKVIPLMVNATQLHPRLEALQYLDFSNRRARPWDRLIEELGSSSETLKKTRKK